MRFIAIALACLTVSTQVSAQQRTRPPRPQVMELTSSAWEDGARIPDHNSQPGGDVTPPLAWDNVPEGTASFVLTVRDLDSVDNKDGDHFLHWLVWNIPGTARVLAENQPEIAELADGTRQISSSGPYYRGPAAPAAAPRITTCSSFMRSTPRWTFPPSGSRPLATFATIQEQMSGKIIGKGVLVGLFKRN